MKTEKRPLRRYDTIRQDDKYHLDRNENPNAAVLYDTLMINLKKEHLYKYPEIPKAYGLMSNLIGERQENMLITAGADDAIRLIFQLIKSKSKLTPEVSMPTPTYQMAKVYANMFGCVVKEFPYIRNNDKFEIDLSKFDTEVIYLANPDNPTGAFNEIDLSMFDDKIVIIDETYIDFVGDVKSMRHLVNKYPNVFVIRTLSKIYGAGAKVGCIISRPKNIAQLNEFRNAYEISNLGMIFLQSAVNEKIDHGNEIVKETLYVKNKIESEFEKMGLTVIKTFTNFILLESQLSLKYILDEIAYYKILKIDNIDYIKLAVPDENIALNFITDIQKGRK